MLKLTDKVLQRLNYLRRLWLRRQLRLKKEHCDKVYEACGGLIN
jgi:hypothetical protein